MDKAGFHALLEGWRSPPAPPSGIGEPAPAPTEELVGRRFRRLRMTDEPVQALIRQQDAWYAWQTRRVWNAVWDKSRPFWGGRWQAFVDEFDAIHEQFVAHARNDPRLFDLRSKNLYRPRVGMSYLLPPEDRGLEDLYQAVLARMKQAFSQQLGPNAHEGHLAHLVLGRTGWAEAYFTGRRNPKGAVSYVLQRISEVVAEQLRPSDRSRPALVARMEDLLANAVHRRDDTVTVGDLAHFRQKLAGMVPGGFAPDGRAPLKALISYPAVQGNPDIEQFLRRELALPIDSVGEPELRAIQADSIVVVMTRTSMGITEIPEARRVIKLWADAQRDPRAEDFVTWRRRLNPEPGYVLMDEQDRQQILHRLLCAAWNGAITITGSPASPEAITLAFGSRDAISMRLDLIRHGDLSSWASVLQAYERWVLADDTPSRHSLAARLLSSTPAGADRSPRPPAPEFEVIVDIAETELTKINETEQIQGVNPQLTVIRQFWSRTLPRALNQHIGVTSKSLVDLREQVEIARGFDDAPGASPNESVTIEDGDHKITVESPDGQGHVKLTVSAGTSEPNAYDLDFGSVPDPPEPGTDPPGEDQVTPIQAGPDGKCVISDPPLTITAELRPGANNLVIVTIDDGSGTPTTYTLDYAADDTG